MSKRYDFHNEDPKELILQEHFHKAQDRYIDYLFEKEFQEKTKPYIDQDDIDKIAMFDAKIFLDFSVRANEAVQAAADRFIKKYPDYENAVRGFRKERQQFEDELRATLRSAPQSRPDLH